MTRTRCLIFVLALGGCGSVKETVDALTVDAPKIIDSAMPDDMPPDPPVARRQTLASTSGGGTIASSAHRMRVRIGAPQPAGRTATAGHTIVTGPGAMP